MASPESTTFPDTRWTLVMALRGETHESTPDQALGELCAIYWKPLYAYARRQGNSPEDAEDHTQRFLSEAVTREIFAKAEGDNGKLRSFLISCFNNHIHKHHRGEAREKRGGGKSLIRLDLFPQFEQEHIAMLQSHVSPEDLYERQCALAVVDAAMRRLQHEEEAAGRGPLFASLRGFVDASDGDETNQSQIATRLGITHSAFRQSLYRVRLRFRELVRDVVRATLIRPTPEMVEEELRALRYALARML